VFSVRLLICAGGTGGGVYPALAVLHALSNRTEAVLWVGGKGGMETELISRENIPYQSIPAAGLHGVGLKTLPGNLIRLARGYFESRSILLQFDPDVLLFTGGYVAVPMALAATARESLLYVPDIEPGLALKTIARFSDQVAVTAEESKSYFPKKPVAVTGYPTRPELSRWTRETGRQFFNITSDKPVLLVFGGSKGARSINTAVTTYLPDLLNLAEIIHISGSLDWEMVQSVRNTLTSEEQTRYRIFPYLHEMGAALAAADLAVSRAGASTLGEYPLFGLPSILVPYPYAWRYQKVNADYLVRHGAAKMLVNDQLMDQLVPIITNLLKDPIEMAKMKKAALALANPDAVQNIASLVEQLANRSIQRRGHG
jgi:UDP-N-acetylglucosamine--N-acetylmuramyl-(pentapeptide) pyrophosphoryl-undecaprenol N-acetylglucosamine transferase